MHLLQIKTAREKKIHLVLFTSCFSKVTKASDLMIKDKVKQTVILRVGKNL